MDELKIVKWILKFEQKDIVRCGKLIGVLNNGQEVNAGHGFKLPARIELDTLTGVLHADIGVELQGNIEFTKIVEK